MEARAEAAPACEPEILVLPILEGHQSSGIDAMNTRGWAVGSSRAHRKDPQQLKYRVAVMWRDGAVLDLGFDREFTPSSKVESNAVDVNESGLVAVLQNRYEDSTWVEASSWLWDNSSRSRLDVGPSRPFAVVHALNDHGDAVGYVSAYPRRRSARPTLWRNGHQLRLPLPAGATGSALGINNHGLVVGHVKLRHSKAQPWYWQVDGPSGPLSRPHGHAIGVTDVDNNGRILGYGIDSLTGDEGGYLWTHARERAQLIDGHTFATPLDMNDRGDLTGYGFTLAPLSKSGAWVSSLEATTPVWLPSPHGSGSKVTAGTAVIRGRTWFSPQPGISVAGEVGVRATIWTCTQRY